MPRSKKGAPPSYRRHSGGHACVSVRDRERPTKGDFARPYDSPHSKIEYQRVLALLKAYRGYYPFPDEEGLKKSAGLTVDQVILAWWKDAERRLGENSKELKQYKYALKPLRLLYGTSLAGEFGPKRFKAMRQRMVDVQQYWVRRAGVEGAKPRWLAEDKVNVQENTAQMTGRVWEKVEVLGSRQALSRKVINRQLVRIRAVFSWAVSEEMIPPSVAHGLREVKGIDQNDRRVKKSNPRPPAFWHHVVEVPGIGAKAPSDGRPDAHGPSHVDVGGAGGRAQAVQGRNQTSVTMRSSSSVPAVWLRRPSARAVGTVFPGMAIDRQWAMRRFSSW